MVLVFIKLWEKDICSFLVLANFDNSTSDVYLLIISLVSLSLHLFGWAYLLKFWIWNSFQSRADVPCKKKSKKHAFLTEDHPWKDFLTAGLFVSCPNFRGDKGKRGDMV